MKPFTSPLNKPKIGTKPSFAIRPKMGAPVQTPVKYENGGAQNGAMDEEINTSPPEQSYGAGLPSSTPPPGPS
jgi:hypothetical protein